MPSQQLLQMRQAHAPPQVQLRLAHSAQRAAAGAGPAPLSAGLGVLKPWPRWRLPPLVQALWAAARLAERPCQLATRCRSSPLFSQHRPFISRHCFLRRLCPTAQDEANLHRLHFTMYAHLRIFCLAARGQVNPNVVTEPRQKRWRPRNHPQRRKLNLHRPARLKGAPQLVKNQAKGRGSANSPRWGAGRLDCPTLRRLSWVAPRQSQLQLKMESGTGAASSCLGPRGPRCQR